MIYLFGVIGMQGIALMISERVNLFDPKQLAIGAVILIVGIGGNIGFPAASCRSLVSCLAYSPRVYPLLRRPPCWASCSTWSS